MKKIMFTLAVALIATMTQAAYVSWKVTNASYANKNVMAFNASQMSAVTALLTAGGESMVSDLTAVSQGSATANNRGVASGTGTSAESSMFFVVFDTTANTYAMTAAQDVSGSMYTPPNSSPGTFGVTADKFTTSGTIGSGGGGESGGTPEPTSGMLLLVGSAMLALRRRRA